MIPLWSQTPGWVLPGASLDLNFAAGTYYPSPLSSAVSVTRAQTVSSYAQFQNGNLQSFAANTARITDQGLLVEQSSTNITLQSIGYSNQAVGGTNGTITANFANGPDGTQTASRYQWTTDTSFWNGPTFSVAASTYTLSLYVKINTTLNSTLMFGLTDGTNAASITLTNTLAFSSSSNSGAAGVPANVTISIYSNGWCRISFATTFSGISGSEHLFLNQTTAFSGDILVWGAQVENMAFPTSYIITAGSSVTRNADQVTLQGTAASAALASHAALIDTNLVAAPVSNNRLLDATGLSLFYPSTTTVEISNGTNTATATIGNSGTVAALVKSAFGYDGSSGTVISNNGTPASSANAFTIGGTVTLGNNAALTNALNGYITRAAFGPAKGQFNGFTQ